MGAGRQVTDAQVKELRLNLNQGGIAAFGGDESRHGSQDGTQVSRPGPTAQRDARPHTLADAAADPLVRRLAASGGDCCSVSRRCRPRRWWSGCSGNTRARTGNGSGGRWNGACGSGRPSTGRPRKCSSARCMNRAGWVRRTSRTWTSLGVTIQGQPFPHLLYHFVLTYSNWEHVTLCFSESFASLSEGLAERVVGTGRRAGASSHRPHDAGGASRRQPRAVHGAVSGVDASLRRDARGDQCVQRSRERRLRAEPSAFQGGAGAGVAVAWQPGLRQPGGVRGSSCVAWWRGGTRAGQRSSRKERARLRPLPARRLETLERQRVRVSQGQHDPGEEEHVLGAGAADGRAGGSTDRRGDDRGVVRGRRWCRRWSGCVASRSIGSTIGT